MDWGTVSYSVAYAASWIVLAIGVLAGGVVAGDTAGVRPPFITDAIVQTCRWLPFVLIPLGSILPAVQRTPKARKQSYLKAHAGELPADIAPEYRDLVQRQIYVPPHTSE
jgi:hypothetical protein